MGFGEWIFFSKKQKIFGFLKKKKQKYVRHRRQISASADKDAASNKGLRRPFE
jgi:hypothetical protein